MRDKALYTQILGIERPWAVSDVELDPGGGEVRIYIEHNGVHQCPECGKDAPGYDTRRKRWRHLDTCQYKTVLIADVPRVECSEHGIRLVNVPWAEPGSGFTTLFERLAIDWLKESSTTAVARLLGLSWNAVDGIMQRAVKRGLARRKQEMIRHIGVDETSFQKRHEYVTVVTDQDGNRVLYVADERKQASLEGFYNALSKKQKESIESVAMDMWKPFINATLQHVPGARDKIAFDRFHVAKLLNEAVDRVRKDEYRAMLSIGVPSLKGSKYLWLRNMNNIKHNQRDYFKELRAVATKTARAWAIKEMSATLWHYISRTWAMKAWKRLLAWMSRSKLKAMVNAARTIRKHLWGIINAIVLKASNGKAEGMNSRIQKLKSRAHGFRNRDRFRNAIYFHLGGLNLYPEPVS
jgi:transposase